ncbi:unnamed protein product, partial [marine sediment metagenome]
LYSDDRAQKLFMNELPPQPQWVPKTRMWNAKTQVLWRQRVNEEGESMTNPKQ